MKVGACMFGPVTKLMQAMLAEVKEGARGVEVGAHTLPVPGLNPFYVDRVAAFAGVAGKIDLQGDALALPFPTESLDYFCSSHVLEHLVNPLAALFEWHRVLKRGGWLYLVVPDKRYTFDEPRPITASRHMLEDFKEGMTKVEVAHVREFLFETDWGKLQPGVAAEDRPSRRQLLFDSYLKDLANGNYVDVHCHTFTPESLVDLLERSGLAGRGSRGGVRNRGTGRAFSARAR